MIRKYCRGTLLLSLVLASSVVSALEAGGDTTFHVPFDGTPVAASAGGLPTPRVYGDVEYSSGVKGQAVVLGGKRRLLYSAAKNVSARAGTMAFWACPQNWTPVVDRFAFFVTLLRQEEGRLSRLLLYKVHNITSLVLLAENGVARERQLITCPAASWAVGEWRHILLTWDADRICVYFNGKLAGTSSALTFPEAGWEQLVVGTSYPSWAFVGEETTAFDELVVMARALSPDEVRAMFQESLSTNRELAMVFEERDRERERRESDNLARAGGYVLASSFQSYKDAYTDNLIDGDPNSIWRPKEPEFPQWIELRWRYPIRIDRIAFEECPPNTVTAARLEVFRNWKPQVVKQVGPADMPAGSYKEITFPEVTTDRLRLVLEAGTGGFPQLCEFEAFGPPQPLVGRNEPYWDAWYIWYPEPSRVHQANSPRYFRKTFEITDLSIVQAAFLQARSNDYYKLFVNGREVAAGSTTIRAIDVKAALREGRNIIAAVADLGSNPGRWGWGEFLAELSLNSIGQTVRVGTDSTWRTHNTEVRGWQELEFDDSAWQPAAPYIQPPGGPWGRIPYHCTAVRERARVDRVTVTPPTAKPGDVLDVCAMFTVDNPLTGDYFFVFNLGDRAVHAQHGEFSVVRAVVEPPTLSSAWQAGVPVEVRANMRLPEFAPDGHVPLHVRAINAATGVELELVDSDGGSVSEFAAVTVARHPKFGTPRPAVSGSPAFHNGQAALRIGDEIRPPLFWRYCQLNSFERSHHYAADTGIHLHHFIIYPHVIDVDRQTWQKGFAELDQNITNTLRVDPLADLMVLVDLRPTNAWLKAHPGERLINGFGDPGPVSYASSGYEAEVHAYTRALIAFLKGKPYYGRVVAIKPMTCGVPDSGLGGVSINTWQQDRSKLTVGDYNPQAVKAFRGWLRAKYAGDVDKLRGAWCKPDVTFETAVPVFSELLLEGVDGGVFRDPTKGRMPFDYFEFLPGLLGRFYQRLAKLIKTETDGKVMVMIHYGYVIGHMTSCNNPGSIFQNNNFDFPDMLADPNIDAYLGAPDYARRLAGNPYTLYFPVESITLHRRQYIADGDYRTFVAKPVIHGRLRSARETEAVLKRDLATCIVGNSGTWFSDMSVGADRSAVGYFLEESILRTVRQMRKLFESALELQRIPVAEIAVFVSPETPKYHDAYRASIVYRNLIVWTYWRELHRIGAPFDCYMMNDLAHPDLRKDYKLYIFLNPFFMSEVERRAVDSLKRDGKTLLWFYAPGYIDDERGLDPVHIGEVTGITVTKRGDTELMRCAVTPTDHPITAGFEAKHEYVVKPFGYPATDRLHPTAFGPVFQVSDPAPVALASYADGQVAFAARDFGTWRSVYTALPYLDSKTLRNVATFAGVHIYCDKDVILDADNRFLMVHSGYDGDRNLTITLPGRKRVTDAISGDLLSEETSAFDLHLPECTTRVLRLSNVQDR